MVSSPNRRHVLILTLRSVAIHVDREMNLETFDEVTHANIALIHKALAGQLQVPDFIGFQNEVITVKRIL